MGLPAFYPGRDLVTVDGSVLAMVSLECGAGGSTLLEAHLATSGDFAAIADLLDAADPVGTVTADLWPAGATTSLDLRLGRAPDLEKMAAMLVRGYESQFPVAFRSTVLSTEETDAIESESRATQAWVASRRRRSVLDRHAVSRVQVGVLEAYYSVNEQCRIDSILFAGDFIANSPAIETLERQLQGCPLRTEAIDRIVKEVFEDDENFILGIGRVDAITRLLTGGSGV
jgi:hypothetical protein